MSLLESSGVLLILIFLLTGCVSQPVKYAVPPKGGLAVVPSEPIWLSGIQIKDLHFTKSYPVAEENEMLKVVNAGYWLANGKGKISQLVYTLELNIKKPSAARVYTRSILTNPNDSNAPFVYEHYLDSKDSSTKIHHSPLVGVKLGHEYHMVFEVYADLKRSNLISKIEQKIISPVGNSGGCVKIEHEYMNKLFGNLKDPEGNTVPPNKVIIACEI